LAVESAAHARGGMASQSSAQAENRLASKRPLSRELFSSAPRPVMRDGSTVPFSAMPEGAEKDAYALDATRESMFHDALSLQRHEDGSMALRDGQFEALTTGMPSRKGQLKDAPPSSPVARSKTPFMRQHVPESRPSTGDSLKIRGVLDTGSAELLAHVEEEDDGDSVTKALNEDPANAAKSEKEKEMFRIQAQIRVIMANKQALRRKARALRREQVTLKKDIAVLEAERSVMGGVSAVVDNDRTVRRGEEIMKKRIMKAKADKMRAIGENSEIRRQIDVRRREKVALLRACGHLEADIRSLQERTKAQLVTIAETDEETRAVEHQVAGVIESGKRDLREMERRWEGLTSATTRPSFGTGIPSPRDEDLDAIVDRELASAERELLRGKPRQGGIHDHHLNARGGDEQKEAEDVAKSAARIMKRKVNTRPAWAPRGGPNLGNTASKDKSSKGGGKDKTSTPKPPPSGGGGGDATKSKPSISSKTLFRSRWKSAMMQAKVGHTRTRVDELRRALEALRELTGGNTPGETVDIVLEQREEISTLYQRIDKLSHEADDIRSQIMDFRRSAREDAIRSRVEDAERRGMLSSVETSLAALRAKQHRQDSERVKLESSFQALQEGLNGILEALDMASLLRPEGEPPSRTGVPPGVTERGEGQKTPSINGRALAGHFAIAEQRVRALLADYAKLSARAKSRGDAMGGSRGHGGGGEDAEHRTSSQGRLRRASVSRDSGVVMSRAERRRSIDLTIADMREAQLMAAIQQANEGNQSMRVDDSVGLGASVSAEALQIGPLRPPSVPATLEDFASVLKADVERSSLIRTQSRKGNRRVSASGSLPAIPGSIPAESAPPPHRPVARVVIPNTTFTAEAVTALEARKASPEQRGKVLARSLQRSTSSKARMPPLTTTEESS
jgi:hypothetical protein